MKSVTTLSALALALLGAYSCFSLTDSGASAAQDVMDAMPTLSQEDIEQRLAKVPADLRESDLFNTDVVEPTRLFDDVYYIGYTGVGAFVVRTIEGLILIDSMWRPQDAALVIEPGMRALGLNPSDIKLLVVTHGHADHYGSARYFQEAYGCEVLMSKTNWEYMRSPDAPTLTDPFGNLSTEIPLPSRYTELKDGEVIALGDTRITVALTPGHTPGTISLLVPVMDRGDPHVAAIWGGTGLPDTLEANLNYLASLNEFEARALRAGVDADISTHPFVHDQLQKMQTLRERGRRIGNPLVIGAEAFSEYVQSSLRTTVEKKIAEF